MLTRKNFLLLFKKCIYTYILSFPLFSLLKGFFNPAFAKTNKNIDLVVIKVKKIDVDNLKKVLKKGIDTIGGINKYIKKGDTVIIKPNIGFNSTPEKAHTTNPILVEAIAKLCTEVGAKVLVMDRSVHNSRLCYRSSGIEKAAKKSGAEIVYMNNRKFKQVKIKDGLNLKSVKVYEDIIKADCVINVPIAKHHSAAGLTLSMKNLMGVIGGRRGFYHINLHKNIVDFNKAVKVDLVILDAIKILTKHGPAAGRPEDIKNTNTIVIGTDPVKVDAYVSKTLFGISPYNIGYLKLSHNYNFANINVNQYKIKKIKA